MRVCVYVCVCFFRLFVCVFVRVCVRMYVCMCAGVHLGMGVCVYDEEAV